MFDKFVYDVYTLDSESDSECSEIMDLFRDGRTGQVGALLDDDGHLPLEAVDETDDDEDEDEEYESDEADEEVDEGNGIHLILTPIERTTAEVEVTAKADDQSPAVRPVAKRKVERLYGRPLAPGLALELPPLVTDQLGYATAFQTYGSSLATSLSMTTSEQQMSELLPTFDAFNKYWMRDSRPVPPQHVGPVTGSVRNRVNSEARLAVNMRSQLLANRLRGAGSWGRRGRLLSQSRNNLNGSRDTNNSNSTSRRDSDVLQF